MWWPRECDGGGDGERVAVAENNTDDEEGGRLRGDE